MFRSGWTRLWFFLAIMSVILLAAVSWYYIWQVDACYKILTISTADNLSSENQKLLSSLREDASTRIFCGQNILSTPLTLEQLAKQKIVTQVGFQWLEPSGWVFEQRQTLDILSGQEITAKALAEKSSTYVRAARIQLVKVWVFGLFAFWAAILGLGIGIAWVRRGFKQRVEPG